MNQDTINSEIIAVRKHVNDALASTGENLGELVRRVKNLGLGDYAIARNRARRNDYVFPDICDGLVVSLGKTIDGAPAVFIQISDTAASRTKIDLEWGLV